MGVVRRSLRLGVLLSLREPVSEIAAGEHLQFLDVGSVCLLQSPPSRRVHRRHIPVNEASVDSPPHQPH
jgi:hypothetical protein